MSDASFRPLEGSKSRETYLELCKLAREGSANARERVAGWTAWPSWLGQSGSFYLGRAPLRGQPSRVRRAELDLKPAFRGMKGNVCFHVLLEGATDDRLVLDLGDRLAVVDIRTFSVLWTRPLKGKGGQEFRGGEFVLGEVVAFVGDDVLVGDEQSLTLHDGGTGEVLKTARGGWRRLDVCGDRALALGPSLGPPLGPPNDVAVLDLGERFGEVLGMSKNGACHHGLAGALGFAWGSVDKMLEAFDLASGASVWRRPIELQVSGCWHADDRGIVFLDADRKIFEADPLTLQRKWSSERTAISVSVAPEYVVYSDRVERRDERELGVIERATGRTVWQTRRKCGGVPVAGDVVYVAEFERDDWSRAKLCALELRSGREIFSFDIELPPRVKEGWVGNAFFPLERSLVFVSSQSGAPVTVAVFEQ